MKINLKFFTLFIIIFCSIISIPQQSRASEMKEEIIAAVNQEIITTYDLEQKIKLLGYMGSIPAGMKIDNKLRKQILLMIVNETLAAELAKDYRIEVGDNEAAAQLEAILAQDGKNIADLQADLKNNGIAFGTMKNHIKAQILWQRFIAYILMPDVNISAEDVQKFIDSTTATGESRRTKVRLAEIVIRDESPESIETVHQVEKMLQEKNADFGKIATDFSQSITAEDKGEIGWVSLDNLSELMQEHLNKIQKGEVTKAIKINDSYRIIKLLDSKQVIGNLDDNAETKEQVRNYLTQKKLDTLAKAIVHQKRINSIISITEFDHENLSISR